MQSCSAFLARPTTYPPQQGGRHGGRLTLISKDGLRTDVSRSKGGPSAGVALTSETGAPLDETMLAQMLGNNSRGLFEQVFAFTLTELHSTDLLEDANVNSQIYSAGMGVTSLPSVIQINRGRAREAVSQSGKQPENLCCPQTTSRHRR